MEAEDLLEEEDENNEIEDLIELLDADDYSNDALIALGEKLLKTINANLASTFNKQF